MDDSKHIPDEAMQTLFELFSKGHDPCKSSGRKYVLEFENDRPVFRRHELCLAFEDALNAIYGPNAGNNGNDIVPQKLAKQFPRSFIK
jgi:hypothetical protein